MWLNSFAFFYIKKGESSNSTGKNGNTAQMPQQIVHAIIRSIEADVPMK